MATATSNPSLFDCAIWALDQPGLHGHEPDALIMLFSSYTPKDCYCIVNEFGRILGVALARRESNDSVRIGFIGTDGSNAAIEAFVDRLHKDFPDSTQLTFKRRGREYRVPFSHLPRMLTLKRKF